MVQRQVSDLFRSFYPAYRGEEAVFQAHIELAVAGANCVLDAGCGSGVMSAHELRASGRLVVGVDSDGDVAKNGRLDYAVRARLDAIPLRDESVDVVVCRYVLEHLDHPALAFNELARVLRPNGSFVLMTPNALHYVAVISRLTPLWLHRLLKRGHGVPDTETFPTYYRANTTPAIRRLAREAGLVVTRLELLETSPNYLEFSRLLYRLGILYERIVNRVRMLAGLRVSIVATLAKAPTANESTF